MPFLKGYIPLVAWPVEFTDEFEEWWNSLHEQEQDAVAATVQMLQEDGPTLRRPASDVIASSKHPNMKELRAKVKGKEKHLRVLYAFDPKRTAILLIGGDKTVQSEMVRTVCVDSRCIV
jgi:hypothetical protein